MDSEQQHIYCMEYTHVSLARTPPARTPPSPRKSTMRALFALLVGYAAAQTAEAPPHIDYEVNLKHTEDVPAEKIVGVFGEIGVQAEAAEYVLAKLKERGEGVVAQCPKAACEKVAKAFTDIGLDAEARKIEVPASDYDGSDVMVLDVECRGEAGSGAGQVVGEDNAPFGNDAGAG